MSLKTVLPNILVIWRKLVQYYFYSQFGFTLTQVGACPGLFVILSFSSSAKQLCDHWQQISFWLLFCEFSREVVYKQFETYLFLSRFIVNWCTFSRQNTVIDHVDEQKFKLKPIRTWEIVVPDCNTRDNVQDVPPATDLVSRLRDSGTECGSSFHVLFVYMGRTKCWKNNL